MRNGHLSVWRPTTHREALSLLEREGRSARFYSGGVQLVPELRRATSDIEALIDVKHLPRVRGVAMRDGALVVGASVTYRQLGHARIVTETFPTLANNVFAIGNPRVRAIGTVGGGLATRNSECDIAVLLAAHDAQITAVTLHGERQYPAEDWMRVPEQPELLTHITVPQRPGRTVTYQRFPRLGTPWAVAAAVRTIDGPAAHVDVLVGCTGGTPARVDVSQLVRDREAAGPTPEPDELAMVISDRTHATDTVGASADYRRHLAGILARRAVSQLTNVERTSE